MKLLASFLCLNLSALAAATCTWYGWWLAEFLVASMFLVASFFIGMVWRSGIFMWAGLCGFLVSLAGGISLRDYVTVKNGRILHGVRIEQFVSDPLASGAIFSDAVVLQELEGSYEDSSMPDTGAGQWHYVAPIVARDWTAIEPVRLWAVCGDDTGCLKRWHEPFAAVLKVYQENSAYQKAVDSAVEAHALKRTTIPMLAEWVESPDLSMKMRLDEYFKVMTVSNIVWLGAIIVWPVALWGWRKART